MDIDVALCTADEVKAVIDTDLSNSQVVPFINTAHQMVYDRLANEGLSIKLLTQIEIWLAAHFLSIMDARVKTESVSGDYSATYEGQTGMGLDFTRYGQMAKTLDPTGKLSQSGKARAGFRVN